MTTSLTVLAHFEALPGKEEDLKKILIDLKNASQVEEGCMFFKLLKNEATPSLFTFIEEWDSRENFDSHLNADHLAKARATMVGVLSGTQDVCVYQVVQ
jgi:quinol monooxygenase YgiN